MKFSLPFFRRKSADKPRNALVMLPAAESSEAKAAPQVADATEAEPRSRWELAAEQLASMNAAGQGASALQPVEPEPPQPVAVPEPVVTPEPLAAQAPAVLSAPEPEQSLPVPESKQTVEPVAVASAEPAEPAAPAAPVGMTREDVVAAYRLFLRRDPESEAVIEPYLGRGRERLVGAYLTTAEFLQRPEHVRLIAEVAQSIERRQQVPPPLQGVPTLDAQDLEAARRFLQPPVPAQEIEPSLEGQPVDWVLACLMRSDAFQRNPFNAKLVTGLAREIAGQLKSQTAARAGDDSREVESD